MPKTEAAELRFVYRFRFPGGPTKEFDVRLDRGTLGLKREIAADLPDWTKLSYKQCANCPLKQSEQPRCPVAVSLVEPLEFFKKSISHEQVEVEVETAERVYRKTTALQYGLGALIGIYMVSSGCPVLDKMRPIVRLHLPFATAEEATIRAISIYLLAQYLTAKNGGSPDWELEKLVKIYEGVSTVNESFKKRMMATQIEDASLNALVHLDLFAKMTNLLVINQKLESIERYFHVYLNGGE